MEKILKKNWQKIFVLFLFSLHLKMITGNENQQKGHYSQHENENEKKPSKREVEHAIHTLTRANLITKDIIQVKNNKK